MISYEVAMGLSIVAVFMTAGHDVDLADRQAAQAWQQPRPAWTCLGWHPTAPSWYAILLLPSFVIYCIAAVGETNRAPFDLPEAESELVGGFQTEYSSFKFALFYLAEYINMITVSAFATTLFLGGWRAPWPFSLWDGRQFRVPRFRSGGSSRSCILLFGFIWLRATLPRMRYDQFMRLGWKVLIPVNLVWILILAGVRVAKQPPFRSVARIIWIVGLIIVIGLVAWIWPTSKRSGPRRPSRNNWPPGCTGLLPGAPDGPAGSHPAPAPEARGRRTSPRHGGRRRGLRGRRRHRRSTRQGGVTWARSLAPSRASG